ncbi:MAG: four helix bundle protein [Sphingobacteriales bacterium]|nr:MAG: four helix bundle protein [Sphingobacteriales bacterium]
MAFKFEKLTVWQRALDLADNINLLTKSFPKDEMFGLTSQIRRAADSVCLNIAEGSTGQSNTEYIRFLRYALRSDIEVVACLYLAKRRNYLLNEHFQSLYANCEEILVMINGLIKFLQHARTP